MRSSGLKWSDLDIKKQRLHLNRGLVTVGYEINQTRGKTKTARRAIELDDTTIAVLEGWRAYQLAECAAVGINPEGVPVRVVSERLGHAHIAHTLETYQHVLPGMQADAARTAERLADPRPTTKKPMSRRRGTSLAAPGREATPSCSRPRIETWTALSCSGCRSAHHQPIVALRTRPPSTIADR